MFYIIKRIIILELEDEEKYASFLKRILKTANVDIVYKKPILIFNSLSIDTIKESVYKDDCLIKLTKNEYNLINCLASHPNRVFSKEQIYEMVWNEVSDNCAHSVENMISRIRKKIEDDYKHPKYIVTVYGFGYKFVKKED